MVLVGGTEAVVALLGDDLNAVALGFADGVDVDGVEDVEEGNDERGGVFLFELATVASGARFSGEPYVLVLVQTHGFRSEHSP